jgi:hypothetical protein
VILTAIILIMLPHHGYWIGGQSQRVQVQWTSEKSQPAADLVWKLMLQNACLDSGTLRMGEHGGTIQISPPQVRTRIAASLVYHIREHVGGKEIGDGEVPIQLFPIEPLTEAAKELHGKKLAVWDADGDLAETLRQAGIQFDQIKDSSDLATPRYDIVLVGKDTVEPSLFGQEGLASQASAGASVIVFAQQPQNLFGYSLAPRQTPARLAWRDKHPLLAGLESADLDSWLQDAGAVKAVRLPADEPALEVAWWPREVAGKKPVPLDVLLVSKSVGKGRIVLCQLPLGDWRTDPRSRIFLRDTLDYLLTRPQLTPGPSERVVTTPIQKPDENRIKLSGE